MDLGRYLLGLVLMAACLGALVTGACRLRATALPEWSGCPARIADAIAFGALALVSLELVGIVGAFDPLGVVVASVVIGLGARAFAGRLTVRAEHEQPRPELDSSAGTPATVVAVFAVAVLTAAWVARVIFAYRNGMETIDTLWYHMPFAARFVQTGSIVGLHYVDNDAITAFYPANSEIFHAFALVLFRSDFLSPLLNLGWAALALAAGWAIGRPYGRARHCLVAVALVLAIPALTVSEPGGAYNDIVCVALLLASAAILVTGGVAVAPSAFAAAAAGLALGTKFTMIVPAVALALGVVVISPRGARLRQAGIWVVGLIGLGGYWYIRNLARVGNPFAPDSLHLGPLSLPAPHLSTPLATFAGQLSNAHAWTAYYLPGLQESFGLAAWAIVLAAGAGSLLALATGSDRVQRMLGVVAALSAIGFMVTPEPIGLFIFGANVGRLGAPALALGLVLLPTVPMMRGARASVAWLGGAAAVLVATQINPSIWPIDLRIPVYGPAVHGASAIAGVLVGVALGVGALGWTRLRGRTSVWRGLEPRLRPITIALAAVLLASSGWWVADAYARDRYASTSPLPVIYRWARGIRDARIGIVGNFLQYPLYGPDDSNYVQYVGEPTPHGGFTTISDCPDWRRAVDNGRYRWLVLTPSAFGLNPTTTIAPEVAWTRSSPAATLVVRERSDEGALADTAELFHVDGPLDPATCPRP